MGGRGFIFPGAGSSRGVWRTLKQVLVESMNGAAPPPPLLHTLPPPPLLHRGGGNAQREIWKEELMGGSLPARWRNFAATAKKVNRGRSPAGGGNNYSAEGLSSLLSHRPDVTIVSRSASALGRRSAQLLMNPGSIAASDCWAVGAFTGGARKMHSTVLGSTSAASLVVRQMQQQSFFCPGLRTVRTAVAAGAPPRRNLSSGTWTEWWNKSTEQVKKAVNIKPKASAEGGGGASVGLKSVLPGGRSREFLSDVAKPVQNTFTHYREAIGLQIEAFWKRNYLWVVAFVGLGVCLLLWRLMFGIASTFISMSEGLAKFGFLALAAAMVIVAGVVTRARFTINPDAVYRLAMRTLNTSAGVLEVMGAPLTGSDLRAYIMSGGGLRIKNFRPRLAGKRCFIIFPIQGSERRGLVSIEVKKKKGKYDFKLLAVDVPTAEADQRLYLIGDEKEYRVGGGLISELRDPMVKAMAAQKEFEDLDLREEEEEEHRAMEADQLREQEARDKLAREREQEWIELDQLAEGQAKAQDKLEKPEEQQEKDEKPTRSAVLT